MENNGIGTSLEGRKNSTLWIREKIEGTGLALSASCTGAPPTTADIFAHGCTIVRKDGTAGTPAIYTNIGSSASPVWTTTTGGTVGTGVTAVETSADGKHFITTLTLTAVAMGTILGAGADAAFGAVIYTFPAGVHLHKVSYISVGLTTAGATKTDTPEVGVGSVIATGEVSALNGTATFEDYVTGSAAANASGTATVSGPIGATAGVLTDISLNKAADAKTVHFNAADGWAAGAAGALTATGTVVLSWEKLA